MLILSAEWIKFSGRFFSINPPSLGKVKCFKIQNGGLFRRINKFNDFFLMVGVFLKKRKKDINLHLTSPSGGIGRRAGLKIQCPLKTCRFEPGPGHKKTL